MDLEDLYRLIRNGHVRAQGIVDTIPDSLLVLDRNLNVENANRSFYEIFKVSRDETIGQHLYDLGNGQWNIPELRRLLEDVIPRSTAVVDYEVEHDFPGLGRRTMLVSARRLFHADNVSRSLLLSLVDATQRRFKEQEKDLLVRELRHRVKNLLAMVLAMARRTTAEGRSGEAYRDAFLGRFTALVRAHELAFSENPEIGLAELVERTLEPYKVGAATVVIEVGPAVTLPSKSVLPLCLILHELATNAVKHGALSAAEGQVRVGWEVDISAQCLRLTWKERGGPPVAPPASVGFGTSLIEFAAVGELGGRAEHNYAPEGLEVAIVASLEPAS